MVTPTAGSIVTVKFPFSDLSESKLRPAAVLAFAGQDEWILCQITSNSFADLQALQIDDDDFANGSLHRISYVRPGKLFTAHESLITGSVGRLKDDSYRRVMQAVIELFRASIPL